MVIDVPEESQVHKQVIRKRIELKNIDIAKDRNRKLDLNKSKKILILGPYKRNIKIIKFLRKDNNDVSVYDKKIHLKLKILKNIDFIIFGKIFCL